MTVSKTVLACLGVVLVSTTAWWLLSGGGDEADDNAPTDRGAAAADNSSDPPGEVVHLPEPDFPFGTLRITGQAVGALVFVDGIAVHDASGSQIVTPCEVRVGTGTHTVTLAQEGHADLAKLVTAESGTTAEVRFDKQTAGESSLLRAAFVNAEVATPLPLDGINTTEDEWDPFLSPDGRTIWFAADRRSGRGIYTASRPTKAHRFSAAQLIRSTRGPDQPATPCVTVDGLQLVFAVPSKARIWSLRRETPLDDFNHSQKEVVRAAKKGNVVWASAQMTGDGSRLIWEERGKKRQTLMARRKEDAFEETLYRLNLPGTTPCLSADGLRQYAFDGTTLQRARREAIRDRFSDFEVVARIDVPNLAPDDTGRPFFVSDDERWLIVTTRVNNQRDLAIVRLPGQWGIALAGAPYEEPPVEVLPPPEKPVETVAKRDPEPVKPPPPPPTYGAHIRRLNEALSAQEFDDAKSLIAETRAGVRDVESLLDFDQQMVEAVEAFWAEVDASLSKMGTGDSLRLSNVKLDFDRYEDGVIHAKSATRTVSRPITSLALEDAVGVVERLATRSDEGTQALCGIAMFARNRTLSSGVTSRLDRGGKRGAAFKKSVAERWLQLVDRDFDTNRIVAGIARIQELRRSFADDMDVQRLANEAYASLFERVQWKRVGRRTWQTSEALTFVAGTNRAAGSYLVSGQPYSGFTMTLEWKTVGPTGQGGVYLACGNNGPQGDDPLKIQLSSDDGVAADMYCTGSLFGREAPSSNAVKRTGEWNALKIELRGKQLTVAVNGRQVLSTTLDGDQSTQGHVALDGGVGGISYRRVLVIPTSDDRSKAASSEADTDGPAS